MVLGSSLGTGCTRETFEPSVFDCSFRSPIEFDLSVKANGVKKISYIVLSIHSHFYPSASILIHSVTYRNNNLIKILQQFEIIITE